MDPTSTTSAGAKPNGAPQGSPKPPPPLLDFKRLTAECSRAAFLCRDDEIDTWWRNRAWRDHSKLRARTMTAHLVGNIVPVGFYAMTVRIEPEKHLGEKFMPLTQGGHFSSVQLCSVAVQHGMQRQGIGTVVMGKALDDFYEVAVRTGIFAMTLVAANRDVVKFYSDLGFVIYGDPNTAQPKMLLPAASVIEARGG